nr:hypothetical protein [Novosphingobium sp. 28-62-57]
MSAIVLAQRVIHDDVVQGRHGQRHFPHDESEAAQRGFGQASVQNGDVLSFDQTGGDAAKVWRDQGGAVSAGIERHLLFFQKQAEAMAIKWHDDLPQRQDRGQIRLFLQAGVILAAKHDKLVGCQNFARIFRVGVDPRCQHEVQLSGCQRGGGIAAGRAHIDHHARRFGRKLAHQHRQHHQLQMIGHFHRKLASGTRWDELAFGFDQAADLQDHVLDRLLQRCRKGRGHHLPPRGNQQIIFEMLPQPRKSRAHRGLANMHPFCGAGDIALFQQHVEGDEQVQIKTSEAHKVSSKSLAKHCIKQLPQYARRSYIETALDLTGNRSARIMTRRRGHPTSSSPPVRARLFGMVIDHEARDRGVLNCGTATFPSLRLQEGGFQCAILHLLCCLGLPCPVQPMPPMPRCCPPNRRRSKTLRTALRRINPAITTSLSPHNAAPSACRMFRSA